VYSDCDISPSALYYAVPNGKHISFLRSHLNGGTFIDIGANIGLVSLLVADRVEHAILFEPSPTAAERAKRNLRANHLNFEVFGEALSDRVGNVEFEIKGAVSACNRTVDGFTTTLPTITVRRTTFDEFLREYPGEMRPISGVKIDVEGHENSVLRGMRSFLKDQRPRLVMFEYLARTDILETLKTFDEVDYSVFELTAEGPRTASGRIRPLQDLFACPEELAKGFGILEPNRTHP
jgi:FkbM family methyltransferase